MGSPWRHSDAPEPSQWIPAVSTGRIGKVFEERGKTSWTIQSEIRQSKRPTMIKLEDLKSGIPLVGLEPSSIVTVAAVVPIGEGAVTVYYRTTDGTTKERLLGRADEANLSVATVERPWSFDGDGAAFQLTCEAKRIDLAFLFDPMMAVHTSNVDPLPHQITAVYESMLPRQPLRFVLADDPGAGKTIMAGLYIRELVMRADAHRILIVAPGSLVEQWRDELYEKFGLEFRIFSSELEQASASGNPFEEHNHLIIRLDQISRAEEQTPTGRTPGTLQVKLLEAGWDLVVFDEAHKLSAHYFGTKLEKTARFRLAERIGERTRHLLLMTAIDHKQPDPRHVEVKGRVKGAATITVTRNEMLYAFNQGDKFVLAIVLVNEDNSYEGPHYIRRPFDREPGWGVSSINYNLNELLSRADWSPVNDW